MPSGGARARSGPAPDPQALRRTRDAKEWVKLKPGARAGVPAPPWPLDTPIEAKVRIDVLEERVAELRDQWAAATDGRTAGALAKKLDAANENLRVLVAVEEAREGRETALWEKLWQFPQATVWETDFQHLNVALYVRMFLEASQPYAKSGDRTTLRQLADSLLMTEPSLHAHKYVIDADIAGATDPDLVATKAGLHEADESTRAKPKRQRKSRFLAAVPEPDETDDDEDAS